MHLAVAAVQAGRNVAVLDLDPQQSAAKWGDRRAERLPVVLAVAPTRLAAELERVTAASADVVFIDTPPRWAGTDSSSTLTAARVADLVIVPARPSIVDLEAAADTLQRVAVAPRVVVVLNGCAPRGREADEAAAALAGRAECAGADRAPDSVLALASDGAHRPGSRAARTSSR